MAISAQNWDSIGMVYALLPIMVLLMMMKMMGGVVKKVTEPEYVKEVAPAIIEAIAVKKLPKGRG